MGLEKESLDQLQQRPLGTKEGKEVSREVIFLPISVKGPTQFLTLFIDRGEAAEPFFPGGLFLFFCGKEKGSLRKSLLSPFERTHSIYP